MKKYAVMALIAFLAMSCTLAAQEDNRRRGQDGNRAQREVRETRGQRVTAQERAEAMARQLELTAEQTAQVQALFERQDARRAEQTAQRGQQQRQQAQRNREETQALRQQVVAEHDAELERIIGREKLEQWREHRAGRVRNAR